MKTRLLMLALLAAVLLAGTWLGRLSVRPDAGEPAAGAAGEREVLYWVAPMDPNFRRDAPGKSPMGMDLVPVYADEVDAQPGTVTIEPAILANFGVRTAEAERSALPRIIETVGYVTYDEDSLQHIHTRVEGWLESLSVASAGDRVQEGELLFELYSPALVNAQEELLAALAVSTTELREASIERLAALGVSRAEIDRVIREREVSRLIRFFSPVDGVVAKLGVRDGMFVTPAVEIVSIASLDEIWVVAEVLERQASWLRPGQTATVTLDAMPGETYVGTVDYVYPELDPVTRTLRVRLRFANPSVGLRPNMFARVLIEGQKIGPVVHVPREAVIRGGDTNRVVVALGNGRFRSTPVELGMESGDRVAIRSGLEAGTPVVVSGQFLIDSESNIGAAFDRLRGDGEDESPASPSVPDEARDPPGMDHTTAGDESMDPDAMDHETMDHDATDHEAMGHPDDESATE